MKFGVVGVGKIGSWLAQTLAELHDVTVFDLASEKYPVLPRIEPVDSLRALAAGHPECVICATPLSTTKRVLQELDSLLPNTVAFGDVASLKNRAAEFYRESGRRFISFHPMFGPTFANMQGLAGEEALIMKESEPELAAYFAKLFTSRGINIRLLSFSEHDKLMMSSLLAPYLSSLLLAELLVDPNAPGTTLRKQREIARGVLNHPIEFLLEVFNATESRPMLARAADILQSIMSQSQDSLEERLKRAKKKLARELQ